MSYTKKIRGVRYLRKYTAHSATPVYTAAIDVHTVSLSLCDVPWERTSVALAKMTSHEGDHLDDNVAERDAFDAALFCANHDKGMHVVYANAAVYRFTVPDAGIGATLESISFLAASDPYNSVGLHIHVFTNSTGAIPMNCRTVRGEDSDGEIIDPACTLAGVVPRTEETKTAGTMWYAAEDTITMEPNLQLQKFLFVLVALENYNFARGNWVEGSGYVRNDFTVTTDIAVDWDPLPVGHFYAAYSGPATPVLPIPQGAFTGRRKVSVPVERGGLNTAYHAFLDAAAPAVSETADEETPAPGVMFNVRRGPVAINGKSVDSWDIVSSVFRLPVAMPAAFTPSSLSVSVPSLSISPLAVYRIWLADGWVDSLPAEILENPAFYDARLEYVGESPTFRLVGSFDSPGDYLFSLAGVYGQLSRFVTIAISAYIPPDAINQSSGDWQGTGGDLIPAISFV